MKKVDTSQWKEFYIGGEKGLFVVVKGKRLTRADMKEGNTNFIGSSSENNGVTNKIGNTENIHKGNLITVSYNGSVGEAFYQEEEFIASDDVNVLYPRFELNKYIASFICPLIRNVGKKYAFIDKWKKDEMEKSIIRLPVDLNGDPDWHYMESYMKGKEIQSSLLLRGLMDVSSRKKTKICIEDWQEYRVGDLFTTFVKPEVYHTRQVSKDDNGIPYVVRSKYNNGIKYRVVKKEGMKTSPGGVVSWGAENATFFYQKEEWCSGRDIYYIDTRDINEYACYFLISCLMFIINKYSYNWGLFPELLKEEIIKLPTKDGKPDWDYMTEYMKTIELQAQNKLQRIIVDYLPNH